MIVLGIDPGYALTGYGFIDCEKGHFKVLDYGVISTTAGSNFVNRLLSIDEGLNYLMDKFQPETMAVEDLFFYRNTTTAIGTAEARGVVLLAGGKRNIKVYEYTPMQIKMAVTGYGHADKNQVQSMVTRILGLPGVPKPDDAADALAVAICHANTGLRMRNLAVGNHLYN